MSEHLRACMHWAKSYVLLHYCPLLHRFFAIFSCRFFRDLFKVQGDIYYFADDGFDGNAVAKKVHAHHHCTKCSVLLFILWFCTFRRGNTFLTRMREAFFRFVKPVLRNSLSKRLIKNVNTLRLHTHTGTHLTVHF